MQQISSNRWRSVILLLIFPVLLLALVFGIIYLVTDPNSGVTPVDNFLKALPWVLGIVALWFIISYFTNVGMVRHATGARSLTRQENPRIYNIVENLTMEAGMPMPKIDIVETNQMNAYACGVDEKSYTVAVTRGLLDTLDDRELSGVIAHELSHIRNKDTQMQIISIVFVGIFSTIAVLSFRLMQVMAYSSSSSSSKNNKNSGGAIVFLLLVAIAAGIGYLFSLLTRLAISRKREYLADACASHLTQDPWALASALRKISGNPALSARADVQQLFIFGAKGNKGCLDFGSLFSTHPDIESRIKFLEQL